MVRMNKMKIKRIYKVNKPYYDKRYIYIETEIGSLFRETKTWWIPFQKFGEFMKRILYFFGAKPYSDVIWFIRNNLTND